MQRRVAALLITALLGLLALSGAAVSGVEDSLDGKFLETAKPMLEKQLKNKCVDNGGNMAYNILLEAIENLKSCVQNNFNVSVFEKEIEDKRKVGKMDEVFAKYCARVPTVRGCVETTVRAIETCLEDNEKSNLRLIFNVSESLVNFACYKDGDRIAMFIAEGGPQCIQSKRIELEKCWEELMDETELSLNSLNNLPHLTNYTEGCENYSALQMCVVDVLETCEDSTPANIVEALFKYVRRLTPCKN